MASSEFNLKFLNDEISITEMEKYNADKEVQNEANKKIRMSGKQPVRSAESLERKAEYQRIVNEKEKRKNSTADDLGLSVIQVGRLVRDRHSRIRKTEDPVKKAEQNRMRNKKLKVGHINIIFATRRF